MIVWYPQLIYREPRAHLRIDMGKYHGNYSVSFYEVFMQIVHVHETFSTGYEPGGVSATLKTLR